MKRWQWIAGGALALALAVTSALAIGQARAIADYRGELSGYRSELDAMYKRSWWEGVERLAALEIELEKLIISDSPDASTLRLATISRQADGAAQSLGALPVERDGINSAMKFVNQIADYSAVLSEGITDGRPISDDDIAQLQIIQARLSQMNDLLYDMDALDSWAGQAGAAIDMSAIAQENLSYPTLIYDGPFSDGDSGGFRALGEGQADEQRALDIAAEYAGGTAQLTGYASAPVEGYEITCQTEVGALELLVSRTGGRVIYMLPTHEVVLEELGNAAATADPQGAIELAARYLAERGFGDMAANYAQVNEGVIVINFAAVQDGVTLYPDLVKVQVSGGRVVGLEAGSYWRNHVQRTLPAPQLTYEQALESVNPRLTVESVRMALIPEDSGERLCYEFTCALGQSRYLVYIDAQTGAEASILKLLDNGTV